MDASADPHAGPAEPDGEGSDAPVTAPDGDPLRDDWDTPPRGPTIPVLHLDGFDGPMDLLLDLAERQRIDFGRMSVLALAEQFVAALERLGDRVAIERKAGWLVLATRLVLLRSRLLVPESAAAAEAAQRDAATELRRIDEATRMRAAAAWLEARPGLGQDVFARGRPERLGVCLEAEYEVDVIAFLWASLALFDDATDAVDTAHVYRPRWLDVYSLAAARARILRRLADSPEGQPFERLLPPAPASAESAPPNALRQRSAWTSTLVASLELAKQGEVVLTQDGSFAPIQVGSSAHPPRAGAP